MNNTPNPQIELQLWTIQQAAAVWGITTRHAARLCAEGKIAGACKLGWSWLIPAGAVRPDVKPGRPVTS